MKRRLRLPHLLLLLICALSCTAAMAAQRALLIGVSAYPTLEAGEQLQGPRNDVARMRALLLQRGFAPRQIRTVADGVRGALLPTRRNILAALQSEADKARKGDTLIVYFAGHGSQQPAPQDSAAQRAEPDGMNEILLPRDVGRWDERRGTITNAIVDTELRDFAARLAARGVFLWAIFDTCHSATLVRGQARGPGQLRYRHVDPVRLGVDAARINRQAGPVTRGARQEGLLAAADEVAAAAGGVFFYAAQSTEQAPERPLPPDAADAQPMGLFTYALGLALEAGPDASYRQIAQHVLGQYAALDVRDVTPVFSGPGLDQHVLRAATAGSRQWPLLRGEWQIGAGSLAGIAPGARFVLLPHALATEEQAIAQLEAQQVSLSRSWLRPVVQTGAAILPTAVRGSYARLLASPLRYSLRVALDRRYCPAPCIWDAVLAELRTRGVAGAEIEWDAPRPDIVLRLLPDRIAVAAAPDWPAAGNEARSALTVAAPASAMPASAAPAELETVLHAIARARNLLQLVLSLPLAPAGTAPVLALRRADEAGMPALQAHEATPLPSGARLCARLQNSRPRPLDVTLLYVDAQYGISVLYPARHELNRLEPGAVLNIGPLRLDNGLPVPARERLLLIASEAQHQTEHADFSVLAQPPLDYASAARRSGERPRSMAAFAAAAFADARVRGSPPAPADGVTVQLFELSIGAAVPGDASATAGPGCD